MKVHYFDQDESDTDDMLLEMAKGQGYVPKTCLLGGETVMACVRDYLNPCDGCACDKTKCKGGAGYGKI